MGVLRIKNSENDRHLGLGFLLNGRGRVIFEFHLAQRCEINQSLVGAIKILKNMSSSMGRIMENKKCLKPPTRIILVQRPINWDMGPQNVSYSDLFSSFEFQLISQHTPFLIRSVGGSQFYFVFLCLPFKNISPLEIMIKLKKMKPPTSTNQLCCRNIPVSSSF